MGRPFCELGSATPCDPGLYRLPVGGAGSYNRVGPCEAGVTVVSPVDFQPGTLTANSDCPILRDVVPSVPNEYSAI